MKTYTYKMIGDLKMAADVYRAADAQSRPVLVYLHGGALIMGGRKGIFPDLREFCKAEGYCLVSPEYRLAPEAKLPRIIEDLRDALKPARLTAVGRRGRWVSEKGPELFHADAGKVVVAGQSAGGYLTLMAGASQPRPKALVSYWGYGDVDGPWYTQPSEFYRKTVPLISREKAYKGMGLPLSGGPPTATNPRQDRMQYYRYLRQNGLWTKEVTGFDPATEPRKLDPYCPVRNVTVDYPPTLLVHGTPAAPAYGSQAGGEDTDVPYQESVDMAEALKKAGVRHEFITVTGAGHVLSNGDVKLVEQAHVRAREFIRENLGSAP